MAQFKSKKHADIVHAMNPISYIPAWYMDTVRILTLHGIYHGQMQLLHGRSLGWLSQRLETMSLKWSQVTVAVSRETAEFYRRLGFNVIYIPNAIDIEALPQGYETLHPNQILYVGRLSKEKNVETLLLAAKELLDFQLVIVGDGPERRRLGRSAVPGRIIFLGRQPWPRTIQLMRGSQAVVLPSIQEGLPTVLLEAMAVGTPVIATRVGGIPHVLTDGENGILVQPRNTAAIRESILQLKKDEKLRKRLVDNARRLVEMEYSWRTVAPQYSKLYRQLAEK